jgi:rhodanese-related sulfurtransferase
MSGEVRVKDLDLEEVKAGLADGSMLVVDVREPHEYAMGRIPGSLSMPLSAFSAPDLPVYLGKRVVFSCAAGIRSIQALAIAQAAGLDLVEHYRGGFKEWAMTGEDVEA